MPDQLTDVQLLQSIWAALRRIEDNMALPPAPLELPAINIAPPDLADVVTAVTSLKQGPTAEEIAAAIAGVLSPSVPQPDGSAALREVAAALEKLDFRLKGTGVQAYGGGAASISNFSDMPVGLTNGQLRAAAVPVSGTFWQTTQPVSVATQPVSTLTQNVASASAATLRTPASGKKLRLHWLYCQSYPGNTGLVTSTFALNGVTVYVADMDVGQPFAHSAIIDGPVNGALTVTNSNTNTVRINADYEEI